MLCVKILRWLPIWVAVGNCYISIGRFIPGIGHAAHHFSGRRPAQRFRIPGRARRRGHQEGGRPFQIAVPEGARPARQRDDALPLHRGLRPRRRTRGPIHGDEGRAPGRHRLDFPVRREQRDVLGGDGVRPAGGPQAQHQQPPDAAVRRASPRAPRPAWLLELSQA